MPDHLLPLLSSANRLTGEHTARMGGATVVGVVVEGRHLAIQSAALDRHETRPTVASCGRDGSHLTPLTRYEGDHWSAADTTGIPLAVLPPGTLLTIGYADGEVFFAAAWDGEQFRPAPR